jgi:hypothetical protein
MTMAVRTDSERARLAIQDPGPASVSEQAALAIPSEARLAANSLSTSARSAAAPCPRWDHGWPVPSSISADAAEARACIQLPEFDALLLEKARVISSRFPFAEAQYRHGRPNEASPQRPELPHFERVFRIAAAIASVPNVQGDPDYDDLLILTAWHTVRPGVQGFLGSYPKALLCPLSHTAPPAALASLSTAQQAIFQRRAPAYLRYLLGVRFALQTCADVENADLRHLLRSTGFRLIRSSSVAEVAFPGITLGDDPPVRPWKLTLRQELSDDRAADLLITAALWQIKHGLGLVTFEGGVTRWNIGAFARTNWEDAFLSLGVRIVPCFMRSSGMLDWRAVLARCLGLIGQANLPGEVLGKVSALPQRISHDSRLAIWQGLDQVARTVLERVRAEESEVFGGDGQLEYESARSFRGWGRLFDEVSPQILSRLGVSAFTALHRVAPQYFGWGCDQLKPWELEQEYGKWKGPRGRALLRSAYAFALYESGLGAVCEQEDQVIWHCSTSQFSEWYNAFMAQPNFTPYSVLYRLASRHGLTPLLNREITHTAAVSLLAGVNVHQNLPRIEGCWELCMRTALEHHGGKLEVRLVLPDLVPLPLRLRKAVLTPLTYSYLHKELRLVRSFDLQMAREARRKLEEIPGWWEDERVVGTPLADRLNDLSDPARAVLAILDPNPWLEARRIRFRALYLLLSKRATLRTAPGEGGLSSVEIRLLLRLAFEATLQHTNLVHVSLPAVTRGFERILAREDTREMLDSLLLHVGAASETEVWGRVRKFIVLDVINDVLELTIRYSLLHLMSGE